VSYFSLARRVPEASAVDPKLLAGLYGLITRLPVVRATYRRFVSAVLESGVDRGMGLDLGTGPGYVAREILLRQPHLRLLGLDLAAHMVRQAQRGAIRAGLNGRGCWPQADAHRLPFADHSFALVVSSFAVHHWADPLGVFNEIARVLAPGGQYCIADLCREPGPLQRMFAYASIPAVSLPFGSYRGYGGYWESVRAAYTRAEVQDMLDRSALSPGVVRLTSTSFVPILTISSR